MKKSITIFALTLLIISCGKEQRPAIPQDYIGNWTANDKTIGGINVYYYINISSNGTGNYEKDGFVDDTKVSGNVTVTKNVLRIKGNKFTINNAPTNSGGQWEMTVNDQTYKRN